jgi:mannose-1-phosphate guanylyltransferase
MKGMILCAGLGTRLRPYTEVLAKPAIPFLNIPLLGYSLFHLESVGLSSLVANTHHLPDTVEAALMRVTQGAKYSIDFSLEGPAILNSGGGIWRAREWLGYSEASAATEDFIVSNGDEVIFFREEGGFQRLLDHHRKTGALCTMLTTMHADVGSRLNGIRTDIKGNVKALSVKEEGTDHFAGVFIFSPRIWPLLKSAYEKCGDIFHIFKDVLGPAIAAGEKIVAYRESDLLWLETSDPVSFAESSRRALEWFAGGEHYGHEIRAIFKRFGKAYKPVASADGTNQLWLGEGARFEGKLDDDSFALLDRGAFVAPGCRVKGFAIVGEELSVTAAAVENLSKW